MKARETSNKDSHSEGKLRCDNCGTDHLSEEWVKNRGRGYFCPVCFTGTLRPVNEGDVSMSAQTLRNEKALWYHLKDLWEKRELTTWEWNAFEGMYNEYVKARTPKDNDAVADHRGAKK
jgi:hypothetical protein